MSQPKFRFSPSALQKWDDYLNSDLEFEGPFNRDADGDYKLSADEIAAKKEQELLDYINKVPQEPSEAADKGTCFNEVVDRLILNTKEGREDVSIRSGRVNTKDGDELPVVFADMDGFSFTFALDLCLDLRNELKGAIPQYHTEAVLPTKYGDVLLHGFIDYVLGDKVIDLKTTKMYSFPKYDKGFQKHVYPYCLIESGVMDGVSEFDYLIVKWRDLVNQPTSGDLYLEPYTYNHEQSTKHLRAVCERFIEWLDNNRDRITNKAIFCE